MGDPRDAAAQHHRRDHGRDLHRPRLMAEQFTVAQALQRQAVSCSVVGSPLYGKLLEGLLGDYTRGGETARVLDGVTDQPVHDALPLRLLATGHLLALTGRAPQLAR